MKALFASVVVLGFRAAALAGQQPAQASSPSAEYATRAAATVRLDVLPAATVAFWRTGQPGSAGAQLDRGKIVLRATQPGELLLEVWEDRPGPAAGARRGLVARAPVRLVPDSSGNASATLSPPLARALEAASAHPTVYTVVIAY